MARKSVALILLVLTSASCSTIHQFIAKDGLHIVYVTTPGVSLRHPGHKGYATWRLQPDGSMACEIEIEPEETFPNKECYQEMLRHEERHCIEGAFHPTQNWGYPDLPHCPW